MQTAGIVAKDRIQLITKKGAMCMDRLQSFGNLIFYVF
jgi:hypothetical protein